MDWSQIDLWKLLAGLGLFLFGMTFLEDAIKSIAGRSFKKFLQNQTGHPLKAVLAGALTTGIMQSSSVVTLLVMSFTGAGIIQLKNGIGMILGANLGTTLTGWIVALIGFKFNLENLFLPITGIGSMLVIFINKDRFHQMGRLLFGFGLMFMGLHYMKDGFLQFAETADLSILYGKPGILFAIFGFILAAAIRSSSASMMIFLASLSSGSITLIQAGYLAIGADLGTTVTGLLGTINGNSVRKKTGWAQFIINIITGILTFIILKPLFEIIRLSGITDPLISLVMFHSLFNFIGILAILPFLKQLTVLLDKYIVRDHISLAKYLPFVNLIDTLTSMDALSNECLAFMKEAVETKRFFFVHEVTNEARDHYYRLKAYENEIFGYGNKLLQNKLNEKEATDLQNLFSALRHATLAVKDIKDIDHNLKDFLQSSDESVFNFTKMLIDRENIFNDIIRKLLVSEHDKKLVLDLIEETRLNYSDSKDGAYTIFNGGSEFDLASMLNLVREIRDSRNLLISAYEKYYSTLSDI